MAVLRFGRTKKPFHVTLRNVYEREVVVWAEDAEMAEKIADDAYDNGKIEFNYTCLTDCYSKADPEPMANNEYDLEVVNPDEGTW